LKIGRADRQQEGRYNFLGREWQDFLRSSKKERGRFNTGGGGLPERLMCGETINERGGFERVSKAMNLPEAVFEGKWMVAGKRG